ncbi:MAG: hypothetical protein KGR26_08345, partial [Cyanobacteria bacterium REEB65]|nr:hypothetical protein [Cyanobacteria bacterium REEB65]
MRCKPLLGALAAFLALAQPADALEWMLPASYTRLSFGTGSQHHDTLGVHVPVAWFGGPLGGPFALHLALGYAYQRDLQTNASLNFVTGLADLDL